MPAECEVLNNGRLCGVPAIGRCCIDGLAFCLTHQARAGGVAYVDMCSPCFQKKSRIDFKRRQSNESYYGESYLKTAAKKELIAAGVPIIEVLLMNVYRPRWVETRKLFGGVKRTSIDDSVEVWGTGWIIGECSWRYGHGDGGWTGAEWHSGKFLTAMIDPESVTDEAWRNLYAEDLFVAVRKVGQEEKYSAIHTAQISGNKVDSLVEVASAIHRLAGT